MDARLLRACEAVRDLPEYFYVHDDGTPVYLIDTDGRGSDERTHAAPSIPQTIQAWTASAVFGALTRPSGPPPGEWQESLTDEIEQRLWQPFRAHIDITEGHQREERFYARHAKEIPAVSALDT
jgi:hypothetical protein